MSKMTHKLRITMLKGMEALGTTAANLASNAKLRVNELNLETRRREILTDFSLQAFELWQKGVQLPEPLADPVVVSVRASHLHPWQAEAVRRLRLRHPDLVVVDHGATASRALLGERAVIAHDTSAIAARAAAEVLLGRGA